MWNGQLTIVLALEIFNGFSFPYIISVLAFCKFMCNVEYLDTYYSYNLVCDSCFIKLGFECKFNITIYTISMTIIRSRVLVTFEL